MDGQKRIFFDANVLVAMGYRPEGDYRRLLEIPGMRFVTSEHLLREVWENLRDLGTEAEPFVSGLRKLMEVTDRVTKLPVGLPLDDDEDRQALAEAIGSSCDEFVTFNSHDFRDLYGQTILGVFIRHSAEFSRLYLLDSRSG